MAGRPLVIPWQETERELHLLYLQETDARRRSRLQVFWLLRQGKSLRAVSEIVEPPYATLQRWVRWYRQGGLEEVLRRVPGHNAPGHPPRLNQAQLASLQERAASEGFDTIWDAVHWVQEEFGVGYSYPGMHALFHRHQLRKRARQDDEGRAWTVQSDD